MYQKKKLRYGFNFFIFQSSKVKITKFYHLFSSLSKLHQANCEDRLIIELFMTPSSNQREADSGFNTSKCSVASVSMKRKVDDDDWDVSVSFHFNIGIIQIHFIYI